MRHISRGLALATVLLLLGTTALSAQRPQTRKGFWIGFGFGYGSYGISCDGCPSDSESSYTDGLSQSFLHLALGVTFH